MRCLSFCFIVCVGRGKADFVFPRLFFTTEQASLTSLDFSITMKFPLSILISGLLSLIPNALLGATSTYRANFYESATASPAETIASTDWDNFKVSNNASGLTLNDQSTGANVILSWSTGYSNPDNDQPANIPNEAELTTLFNSFLHLGSSDGGITISELIPGDTFTMRVYGDMNQTAVDSQNRNGTLTVLGASQSLSWENMDGATTSMVLNDGTPNDLSNVMDFSGTVDASGAITLKVNPSSARSAINGFELTTTNENNPPPFIASFTPSSTSIPQGESVALTWVSSNATSLNIDQGVGDVTSISINGDGNINVSPTTTTTYTLTASNTDGNATQTLTVNVVEPSAPVIESFTATPLYFPSGGTIVTLNWKTSNADTLTLNQNIGDVTAISTNGDGTTSKPVPTTTTFTLTATNNIGTSTANVTVREVSASNRPNILFFFVDDMGWQDTSEPFHTSTTLLNDRYRTPNMESLAAQGRKFTQAYACSICSPTRVSLMTGMNAARHKVTTWTKNKDSETSGSTAELKAPSQWNLNGLGPAAETYQRVYNTDQLLPLILQQSGYRTIHAGKAHFGASTLLGADPTNVGFDVNIAGTHLGGPGSYLGSKHYGTNSWHVPGLDAYYPENNGTGEDVYLSEALTREINKNIETAVADGVPFFAYMAHYAIHVPLAEDVRFSANYTFTGTERTYATMIEGMDKSLGDIIAKLETLGVAENTLVIFYSDNGGLSFTARGASPYGGRNTHNWPLRAGKGSAYEGGTRVPFIAAWAKPDASNPLQQNYPIPQNTICNQPVIIEDLMPTVLTAAGIIPPANLDGFDITGYIQNTPGFHRPNDTFLFNVPHVWSGNALGQNQGYEPNCAMRDGDWKIIYLFHNKRWELYYLPNDIHEDNNLVSSQPEKFLELARKMSRLMDERGGQYPESKTTNLPIPLEMPDLPNVDLDADGIPDNLEDINRNGLVDAGETDPNNNNSDGDNINDGDELRIGTDPLDANSHFHLTPKSLADNTLKITWPSAPGSMFTIRRSNNLNDWSVIVATGIPASSGSETSYNLGQVSDSNTFFRVELEQTP